MEINVEPGLHIMYNEDDRQIKSSTFLCKKI